MRSLVIFLMLVNTASALTFNEVMYNPPGNDNDQEFVELHHAGWQNLSGYVIADQASNDTLLMVIYYPSNYSLVVEDGFDYSGINASIYTAGATIGNNLDNTGDALYIFDNNLTPLDYFSYNDSLANGNNRSLERFNGSWHESIADGGTPGRINSWHPAEENTTLPNVTSCGNLSIIAPKYLFMDEPIKFSFAFNDTPEDFHISYWVEDMAGLVVKPKLTTGNTEQKSFTPKIDGLDQSFMIMAELENCTSSASLLVTSVRTPSSPEISIEPGKDIIDSDESLYVDIEVNPGNSSQELNVYLSDGNRKISKTTSVQLPAYAASTLTAAISPNNRCQQSGSYLLRAEAEELSASRPIAINQAASCQEKSQISADSADAVIKQPKTEAKLEYELASIPVKVDTNQSFIVELYLNNSGNIPLSADAWSYVYRGSISYSGERMQNLVHLALLPGQENRIYFNLSADVPETELYKVKLRINSSARKTLIELTRDLFITVPSRNITQSVLEKSAPVTKARELSPVTGNIVSEHYAVYESPSAKTAKLALFFLLAVSVVMNVFLLWKRA